MDSIKVQQMTDKLHKTGWTNKAVGYYKSGSQIKQIPNFEVFVRNRNFDDFFKKSSLAHSGEPHKMEVFKEGSSPPMGNPKPSLTPGQTKALPALADFENYPSLMSARPNKPCILIGYDSEWENLSDGSRDMLSWQFAVIHNLNLIEFCFIRTGNKNLTFDLALGCILDCLEIKSVDVRKIRRYQYCSAWNNDENKPIITTTANLNEARSNYKYVYRGRDKGEVDGWTHELVNDMPDRFVKRANRDWAFFHTFLDYKAVDSVKVTLLCHTGLVDISGLASTEYLLKHLSDVQGGLVTMQPIRTAPRSLKNVNNTSVYPRTSDGLNGVYVAGSYIYLALRLGAEVFCENGYFLNTLLTDDLKESRSLSYAVIQLVQDRNKAKADHGKKSLEELILKTMVNSGYGKNAQNVVQKQSWVAYKDLMEDLGCSAITNPVSAMMITSIVQCELIAAQNQMHELGYVSCSVTTDGFISDCPEDVLKSLDLYGFRPLLEQSRLFLTGGTDKELWEIKHHQDDLINFTTRGNVSLHPHGVCAHNSAKSGFESDSYEDRLWLMTQVLSRTGTVDCVDSQWASFKDIVQGKTDFKVTPTIRHLHMDFDLKRKPDRSTFHTDYPIVDGITYEIAHFDTLPYDTVAEFRLHRKKKKLCDCLRTQDEWDVFFLKIDTNACGMNVKDLDWSILMSVIMGYRAGKWDIPALNGLTVVEKCEWINKHNTSKKQFKQSDWKNSRRPERQVNMLPDSYLLDKLTEMQNAI